MAKKGKNSKKVGTISGDINNNNSTVAIIAEDHQDEQQNSNADIEATEKEQESFVDGKNMSDVEQDDENGEVSEEDEVWELKKIMSIEAIKHTCPVKCSHDTCSLVAATVWVSNQKPDEKWYSCLDCQENDFGGWPDIDEIPLTEMTHDHKRTLVENCSKFKDCAMPSFDFSPTKDCNNLAKISSNTITPPPVSGILGHRQEKLMGNNGTVTPNTDDLLVDAKKKACAEIKPSKAQLEIHRKWQAAAEAAGGQSARIVLHKAAAKKIIFDFLFDAFCPMNITEIHKGLKAIIPSPILKACLDDMALDNDVTTQFADSDSEDEGGRTSKKPVTVTTLDHIDHVQYKKSLIFKGAKGNNSGIYYVNYGASKGGDGLDRDEKNQLASDSLNADLNYSALQASLGTIISATKKLETEPFNCELDGSLETAEKELLDVSAKLEVARAYQCNEKHKEGTIKRIHHMSSYWRKRRKICMDFLISLEELTEGTISVKACLSGSGPLEIESDEAIIKLARDFAAKKRSRSLSSNKAMSSCKIVAKNSGVEATDNFVAVALDSQGTVQRIHLLDEKNSE